MKYSEQEKQMILNDLFKIAKNNGHSIQKIANVTKVSAAYISKVKNGHRNLPSDNIILKLKKYIDGNYDETELKTKKSDEYLKGYERGYKDALKKMRIFEEDFKNINKKIRSIRGEIFEE